MKKRSVLSSVLMAAALAFTGLTVMATPAQASQAEAQRICGSGYQFLKYMGTEKSIGAYLFYNSANGNNCAVGMHQYTAVGVRTKTNVWIQRQSDLRKVIDEGSYAYYAGPVYLYARNTCVKYGAYIDYNGGETTGINYWYFCG
ncbi:hypothetical protein HNP84_007045 [Thermocatellispora tengchongensis]|uniref:Spore-associated protein A n=1 Tax=Thermocatellispora tengchongensis TaxID=1073253 RepID=A0A840PH92_9ACTN|nr:hypothetical protein [Thermocatellispora tengchongensis]MBB5137293.1 hypothetical protein [Thermocatellispora tengchongensis]